MNDDQIEQAVHCLHAGQLIAYPTESVYGLGCDPFNQQAVTYLLTLKQRRVDKGFILVASEWEQIEKLITPIPHSALLQIQLTWPGPITWVFPAAKSVPKWICGAHDSVAIRISDHPIVKALCTKFNKPIISTSANREGQPPARDPTTVSMLFGNQLACIVKGELGQLMRPTMIRDAVSGEILRLG